MRLFYAAAAITLLVAPAHAQTPSIPKYGETAKPKSPQEMRAEKEADKAYQNSLSNIPDQGPTESLGQRTHREAVQAGNEDLRGEADENRWPG